MKNFLKSFCVVAVAVVAMNAMAVELKYDKIAHLRDQNERLYGVRSMADGEHYTILQDDDIKRYRYDSKGEGVSILPSDTKIEITDYELSDDANTILIASGREPIYRHSYTTTYHIVKSGKLHKTLPQASAPRDATLSPDAKKIAYSDKNDLYIYNIERGNTLRITDDGEWNSIINGTTDWVYEEEFGFTRAYAFSPDSRKVAFLRFDESEVPLMEMMRFDGKLYNSAYTFKYPKAGDKNSVVELWVADSESGERERIDVGAEKDQYIPRIGWTPDGLLWYYRLNRAQNHFEVVLCQRNGAQRVIYEERSRSYVERVNEKSVTFIDADRFIVRQESFTGYMHLYLYSIKGGAIAALTEGEWEVTELVAATPKRVWYISNEGSPLRRALYSVDLKGGDKRRLGTREGTYSIAPSAEAKYFLSTFSSATTPNQVEILAQDGKTVRSIYTSEALHLELLKSKRPHKEFFSFTTERGDNLNAYIIKPKGFSEDKKYPVLITQYSGPGSQSVRDVWSLGWEDALVDEGYIVVCADTRGTGGRGEEFKKLTYARLGALETEDQISLAKYMQSQSYVDSQRIGIYGWSYGGFISLSCALKAHGLFKMAIAVAPVTSWRYYDTIYTEIYNSLPQYNAEGYDDNSPINFARLLDDASTRLLLIHGTADDNVHLQNTIEMSRALNRAGKQYDMMLYPDQNHSMMPDDTSNVREKMIQYTLQNL